MKFKMILTSKFISEIDINEKKFKRSDLNIELSEILSYILEHTWVSRTGPYDLKSLRVDFS